MKNLALIIAVAFFASISSFGQNKSELKGPAFKNYKPWKNESKPKTVYSATEKKQLTGPAYKNQKPWEKSSEKAKYVAVNIGSERSKLEGPAYKNHKPWRNDDEKDNSNSYIAKNEE